MTTPNGPDSPVGAQVAQPGTEPTADELVADIEATRAELGATVDALSRKLDVKAQAQNALDDAKQRATEQARTAQARGVEMFNQVKDASTDEHGDLTPQARAVAIRVAAGVAAFVVVRALWRKVRR